MADRPALDGVLVLELGGGLASVLAGMLLAEHGARVIKVEPPSGSPERARPGHRVWNRGKQSVVLDFQLPHNWLILEQLLARADVALYDEHAQSRFREACVDQLRLSGSYPRLIVGDLTGYGARGPLADAPANDDLIAAWTGRSWDQSGWEPGPSHVVARMPSIAAGLLLVQGVAAALLLRQRTGRGQRLSTSLLGATLAMSGAVLSDRPAPDRGLSPAPRGSAPFYAAYACRDDAWVQIGCLHGGFVRRAIEVIDSDGALHRLADDPGFGDGVVIRDDEVRTATYAVLERAFRERDQVDWLTALEAADVPAAAVQPSEAFLEDPQALVNGLVEVRDPDVGPILQAGASIRLSATPARVGAGAPRLGSDQSTILFDVGRHA